MKPKQFSQYAAKWGNCLAIRIPNNLVKQMGIEPNTPLDVKIQKTEAGDATEQLLAAIKKLDPALKRFSDQEILNSFVFARYSDLTGSELPESYQKIQKIVSRILKELKDNQEP